MTAARILILGLTIAWTSLASAAPQSVPHIRRVAIVVGANQPPPGRQALRYAHDDAKRMSEVLRRVGDFADVRVLLDPRPRDLLATLQNVDEQARAAGGTGLVVFYYSGHSDGRSIFPNGETLALTDIRDRLAAMNVRIRVGILDTCRGGGWTQTKGLSVGPPLDPIDLLNLATEGTALIASSAGLENAHEGDAVKGSFFTHHLAAGLLGAADSTRDGDVTLQEVFDYAKARTIRDTALLAPTPQHPSFDIDLRGRQDIVLASIRGSASALVIAPPRALLQVVHLDSGLVIAEAPPSTTALRLAVAPGQYLVRRSEAGRVWAKQVAVRPGQTIKVAEADLQLSGTQSIAMKGDDAPIDRASTSPQGWWIFQVGAGVTTGPSRVWGSSAPLQTSDTRGEPQMETLERSFALTGGLTYGITDRLTWAVPLPAFAYRFGEAGELELIARGGLTGIGYSSIEDLLGTVDAGAAVRAWVWPSLSLVGAANVDWEFNTSDMVARGMLTSRGSVGLAWEPSTFVSVHFGTGLAVPHRTTEPPAYATPLTSSVSIGSIQSLGYRSLPLIQLHLTPKFSIDGYASWSIDVRGGAVRDRYLGGITWAF